MVVYRGYHEGITSVLCILGLLVLNDFVEERIQVTFVSELDAEPSVGIDNGEMLEVEVTEVVL